MIGNFDCEGNARVCVEGPAFDRFRIVAFIPWDFHGRSC